MMPTRPELMHFVVIGTDAPASMPHRTASLADHRRYVDDWAGSIVLSGPLLADDSDMRTGQFYVLEVTDRSVAEAFINEDPFTKAGVFDRIEITRLLPKFEARRRL